MAAAVLVIGGVICCCFSSVAGALIFPIPGPNAADKTYEGFTETVSGRMVTDPNNDAYKPGTNANCILNCELDFTCNSVAMWEQSGNLMCLKLPQVPNPWMTLPQYIVNKTNSKIYVKNK